jgi:hypothetical protein
VILVATVNAAWKHGAPAAGQVAADLVAIFSVRHQPMVVQELDNKISGPGSSTKAASMVVWMMWQLGLEMVMALRGNMHVGVLSQN